MIERLRKVLNEGKNMEDVFDVIWENEALRNNVFGNSLSPQFRLQSKSKFIKEINDNSSKLFNSILITK